MIRYFTAVLLILLCALTVLAVAATPIAGKWDCVSTDERGTEVDWTLAVTDNAGKLSGSVTFAQTGNEVQIFETALKGNMFSFKIQISAEEIVEMSCRVDGSKLEGTFQGRASGTGTFKGTRHA